MFEYLNEVYDGEFTSPTVLQQMNARGTEGWNAYVCSPAVRSHPEEVGEKQSVVIVAYKRLIANSTQT